MAEPTLTDEIITIVKSYANNNPAPEKCKITKIYTGNQYVDVETNIGTLTYIEVIGNQLKVGNTGILVTLNDDNQIVITK